MSKGRFDKESKIVFFTEFSNSMRARDMYQLFKDFGEIYEVVIPLKRDKRGRKYGSVCFYEVRDVISLILKLDNLLIEGMKLYVNLPRFYRVVEGVFTSDKVNAKGSRGGEEYEENIGTRSFVK